MTRIDRDVRPTVLSDWQQRAASDPGGVVDEYPFVLAKDGPAVSSADTSNRRQSQPHVAASRAPVALRLRAVVKIPTAGETDGAGTGKPDVAVDAIVSREISRRFELTGFGGFIARRDPDLFDLTNGLRWGAGAAMPTRKQLRLTAEVHGETYTDRDVVVRTPSGVLAALVPLRPRRKVPSTVLWL